MKYTKLCLVMTDRCTAACDFCGFSCSPDRHQAMDAGLMTRMIREARELGVKRVSFSGGEPFLYPELLEEGVRTARAEGMGVNIATNGFWGAWDNDRIREVLQKVLPDSMGFSYDFFHKKFVKEDSVMRAIKASVTLNIKTTMHVADLKGEYAAGQFIRSLGTWKYGVDICLYPAYRCGRAESLPREWFLTAGAGRENISCLSESKLSVLYNGDVYPCCRHQAFETAMKLGSVRERSLKDVLDASDVPMICDVLARTERFRCLLEQARARGLAVSDEAGCSCDYCRMLFGTEENKRRMLPDVEALHGEMLVRSLMKEAVRDVP